MSEKNKKHIFCLILNFKKRILIETNFNSKI